MGYYKNQNIDALQKTFEEEQEALLAEKAAAAYLQPYLSQEFSDYPEADSLLDFVKAFNQRKALMAQEQLARELKSRHSRTARKAEAHRLSGEEAVPVKKAR